MTTYNNKFKLPPGFERGESNMIEDIHREMARDLAMKYDKLILKAIRKVDRKLAEKIDDANIPEVFKLLENRISITDDPLTTGMIITLDGQKILRIFPAEYSFEGNKVKAQKRYKILV